MTSRPPRARPSRPARRLPGPVAAAFLAWLALAAPLARADPVPVGPPAPRSDEITAGELRDWVRTLASDAMEGRETGESGCDRAAELVAGEFSRLGLRPAGDGGSWFQAFTIPRGVRVLPTTALAASDGAGSTAAFELATQFVPLDVSGPGDVEGEVAFAGYGVRAKDLRYDDYEGLDVRGKVVVVLRHAPAWQAPQSPFSDPKALETHGSFAAKAEAAVMAGALALVVVNDPGSSAAKEKDELRPPGGGATGKLPVVQLTWRAAPALERALGVSFADLEARIDASLSPASRALTGPRIRVRCDLEPLVRRARNVAAVLAARPPPAVGAEPPGPEAPHEALVIGAHYDHVGRGKFGSLAKADGEIHNGADDNASGTAAMLEIAGRLTAHRAELRRDVVFLAFSGEELGLFGSRHYVASPSVPLDRTVGMINLDMVGRLDDERLFVGGSGTSPLWPSVVERWNAASAHLRLRWMPGGRGPSDHDSFYAKGLPVLFFFTGLHADYHRPTDDWDRLDYDGEARVARLACDVATDLLTRPDRLPFAKADDHGFDLAPTLGLALAPGAPPLVVASVEDHGPARRAGLLPGDVLLSWDGEPLLDAKSFEERLKKSFFGQIVDLTVLRDGTLTLFPLVVTSL